MSTAQFPSKNAKNKKMKKRLQLPFNGKPTALDVSVISPMQDFYCMVIHPHKDLPSE